MRQLMEYHIISGKVIETRRSVLPVRSTHRTRGTRRAGASSAKKISNNEKQEVLRLARVINTNFGDRGYLVTLKYSPSRLPSDYEELCANGEKLMRKLRDLCKKEGTELHRILINANWSPKRNAPARLHHHLIINRVSLDLLRKLWPEGEIHIKSLEPGDLTGLAAYLCANVKAEGKRKWWPSKGLKKPIYSEPVPVKSADGIDIPAGAAEVIQEPTYDEDGVMVGAYMRCTLPAVPMIRGGQIVIPRNKRGGHKRI